MLFASPEYAPVQHHHARGQQREPHHILCWEHIGNKAVRQGNWKLVGAGDPASLKNWELYNLAEDLSEQTDLSATNPEKAETLFKAYMAFRDSRELRADALKR